MTTNKTFHRSAACRTAPLALVIALSACGGDGDGDTAAAAGPVAPAATTTAVTTTVIDGALKDAVVCIDKNGNGACDADELKGRTDASGTVTLAVPNADVGKYPVVAVVGTDAVDADHGPVTVAYTLSTPADRTAVVSSLTTLVQQTIAATGVSSADAAAVIQSTTGLAASPFDDYTKTGTSAGNTSAATVARMIVVATQQQAAAVANAKAADGTAIAPADLDKAVQKKILELLPALVTALGTASGVGEAAIAAAASTLVDGSGLNAASAGTLVAINKAVEPSPATPAAPTAGVTLADLSYNDANAYSARLFTSSAAQAAPDANNNVRFVDRRLSKSGDAVARWGAGGSPARGADVHWNGKAWTNCPVNFENTAKLRDAAGNGASNYCDGLSLDTSTRATVSVAGRTMAEVVAQARGAGYTNLFIADPSVLGSTTFPTGSSVLFQTNTPTSNAIGYYPGGAQSPVGTSNIVSQYSAEVAAGDTAPARKRPAPRATRRNRTSVAAFLRRRWKAGSPPSAERPASTGRRASPTTARPTRARHRTNGGATHFDHRQAR